VGRSAGRDREGGTLMRALRLFLLVALLAPHAYA
jgi:hypothetical protein